MNIIFMCSGNTCRSPMAQGYLESKGYNNLNIISRGFLSDGESASENSLLAMKDIGIDISAHLSKRITADDLKTADKIICMSQSHLEALQSIGVEGCKLSVLGGGIPDPFGCDITVYRDCRDAIIREIDLLIKNGFFSSTDIVSGDIDSVKDIVDIENGVFSQPWSERSGRESLEAGTIFLIAYKDKKAVGYVGMSAIVGEGYITNVAVIPEYRRQGIGQRLLESIIELGKKENLEFISLEVRVSNVKAISLYNKMGFKEEGKRKRFYTQPTEDAIILTRRF